MRPNHITFTGVDAHTDLKRLAALSRAYPCEWGVLFSRKRQGGDNRYPALDVVERILDTPNIVLAAHICGAYAEHIMDEDELPFPVSFERFSRLQVNHKTPVLNVLANFAGTTGKTIIGQARDMDEFPASVGGVQWLYDPSGGNGLLPEVYPFNDTDHLVGYAGGINPDNVEIINYRVNQLSPAGYWLDMESGVRTDDIFDLDKVQAVLEAVYD